MGADNTLLNQISCGLLVYLALKWMKGIKTINIITVRILVKKIRTVYFKIKKNENSSINNYSYSYCTMAFSKKLF